MHILLKKSIFHFLVSRWHHCNWYTLLISSSLLVINLPYNDGFGESPISYSDLSPYPTNFFNETFKKLVNQRPIIGVIAIRSIGTNQNNEYPMLLGKDFFGSEYVKFVESTGARVIPIPEVCFFPLFYILQLYFLQS